MGKGKGKQTDDFGLGDVDLSDAMGAVDFGGVVDLGAAMSDAPDYDPLAEVPTTESLEADAAAELAALEEALPGTTAYRDRAKQEAKRFTEATDSEFWVAIYFRTRDEKDEFLRARGLTDLGDKYLYGPDVARRIAPTVAPEKKPKKGKR